MNQQNCDGNALELWLFCKMTSKQSTPLTRLLTDLVGNRFATWYMRTSYLANVKDAVGERLINVNSSILNTPGFRAAGWTSNAADLKRTYSPPIPTSSRPDYFQAPIAPGLSRIGTWPEEEEEEGGVVTGRRSNDTIGPAPVTKRRRRREQIEEEDSSDLSDESDEELDNTQRAAQQIKFTRMPVRNRADSSPIRSSDRKEGPELMITSPSRRSTDRLRRGSLGAVEAIKARARADTATSSEISSENESLDPSVFARRRIGSRTASFGNTLNGKPQARPDLDSPTVADGEQDHSDADSVASTMSSEFGETLHSGSLLDAVDVPGLDNSSPILSQLTPPDGVSPKKPKPDPPPVIQEFARPRPLDSAAPVSILGEALKARKAKPVNPIEVFAGLSGKGSPNPLWIKIYAPFSEDPETPFEIQIARLSKDGENTTVAEAIGLSLWRYTEEKLSPPLAPAKLDYNKWTLRMVEDGEVDYDFPALSRTKALIDFTLNNNRGVRGRSREKPWDEFALVEATPQQAAENDKLTPARLASSSAVEDIPEPAQPDDVSAQATFARRPIAVARAKPIIAQLFSSALSDASRRPADMPDQPTSFSTPRVGAMKTIRIRHLDIDSNQSTTIDISTDSYIAEILDQVCKLWNLDKAAFTLRVSNTVTMAPLDRTVEALGSRTELDLVRRRFGPGPLSLTGSPDSASPNAPLLIDIEGPKKGGKKGTGFGGGFLGFQHPLAQKQDLISSASNFKKYTVTRKHLTAFSQASHKRVLALDADYMHIMPTDMEKAGLHTLQGGYGIGGAGGAGANKTASIPFADITATKVSSRHPKVFRVIVRRAGGGGELKRYDFEAKDQAEAREIVEEIRKVMVPL